MKFVSKCFLFAVLIVLSMTAVATAQDNWVGVQLPYDMYGHVWNTDNGASDGNPVDWSAATATINSFWYLQRTRNLPLIGPDIVVDRNEFQQVIGAGGFVTEQSWWEGKVWWWQQHSLDWQLIHGFVDTRITITTWQWTQNIKTGYITWDWLWDQLYRQADVELELIGIDNPATKHVVTLTSLHFNDTNSNGVWDVGEDRLIDFLDPDNPTLLKQVQLWEREDHTLWFEWNATDVWVAVAFSEAPEPSALATLGLGFAGLVGCVLRRRFRG